MLGIYYVKDHENIIMNNKYKWQNYDQMSVKFLDLRHKIAQLIPSCEENFENIILFFRKTVYQSCTSGKLLDYEREVWESGL